MKTIFNLSAKEIQKKLQSEVIEFSNTNHEFETGGDDISTGELIQSENHSRQKVFNIWFNGKLIHSSKTFQSAFNRLHKLVEKWNLKQL